MIETNFLLTGASGFLGTIILDTLSSNNSVFTIGRNKSSSFVCDFVLSVPELSVDSKIGCVIHAAGKAHTIPKNQTEEEEFYKVNFVATKNLTDALGRLNQLPKQFIFISSVAVYGKESGEQIDEDQLLLGGTPYAKSKIKAEKFLQDWSAKNGVKLTILRLPLVVGINPPGNLGAMIKLMRKGLYFGIGSGEARRSMVCAKEVAKFLPAVKEVGGIFNLTDGDSPSVRQFENALAKALGKRKPIRLPDSLIKRVATIGDYLGENFPLNTNRYMKLTSSLTFSDCKARKMACWSSNSVLNNLTI